MDIKILVTPKSATTTFRITQHGRKDINGPLDPGARRYTTLF